MKSQPIVYPRVAVQTLTGFLRESIYGEDTDLDIRRVKTWCEACVKLKKHYWQCELKKADLDELTTLRTLLIDAHNVGQTTFVPDEWSRALPALAECAKAIQSYLDQQQQGGSDGG